jgi:uroporphyrinogen decarboxylase
VRGELAYVAAALRLLRRELAGDKALLGFGGSPWTLACYMIEGGGSEDFPRALRLFRSDRPLFDALLERLTSALIDYFLMQIEAGADALQIFDTWGGLVVGPDYEAASLQWIRRIVVAMPPGFPIILYAKGAAAHLAAQAAAGVPVLGVDWTVDLPAAYDQLTGNRELRTLNRKVALQGNLDPAVLSATPETVRTDARRLLESMRSRPGYIFNLGHGIRPDAKLDCVAALVDTVTSWR